MGRRLHGIDVSSNNGTIDWRQVARHTDDKTGPVRFAVCRAFVASTRRDSTYERNLDGALSAGLYTGAYAAPTPSAGPDGRSHVADARRSVAATWAALGAQLPQFLALDFELANGLPPAQLLEYAAAWVEEWATGYGGRVPWLYSFPSFLSGLAYADHHEHEWATLAACPLWIAQYHSVPFVPTDADEPQVPRNRWGWDRWTAWQYSGDVGVPVAGVPTRCDRDVFNGGISGLRELCGLAAGSDTTPEGLA